MTALITGVWVAFAANLMLFSVLYFCIVLLRINDTDGSVKSDALFSRNPRKYLARYRELLTPAERSRWHNVFLQHSLPIGCVLAASFLILVFLP